MTNFLKATGEFLLKIRERSVVKRKEMDAEREAEEAPPLGPGGLDPIEVLGQLPASLRDAFESQEISNLHKVLNEMEPAEAKRWMKMCVDAGLWVPSADSAALYSED